MSLVPSADGEREIWVSIGAVRGDQEGSQVGRLSQPVSPIAKPGVRAPDT